MRAGGSVNDIEALVTDLRRASRRAQQDARGVIQQATIRVRDEARQLAPKRGLPHYARSISAETTTQGGTIVGEVGPEKGGQGSLGHLLEYGTSRTAPRPHLAPALDHEEPRLDDALADILDPFRGWR